jgi:hypothetical protein
MIDPYSTNVHDIFNRVKDKIAGKKVLLTPNSNPNKVRNGQVVYAGSDGSEVIVNYFCDFWYGFESIKTSDGAQIKFTDLSIEEQRYMPRASEIMDAYHRGDVEFNQQMSIFRRAIDIANDAGYSINGFKRIVMSAVILHTGWELDNEGWVIEDLDGNYLPVTTNHMGAQVWDTLELIHKIRETKESLISLEAVLALIPQRFSTV